MSAATPLCFYADGSSGDEDQYIFERFPDGSIRIRRDKLTKTILNPI